MGAPSHHGDPMRVLMVSSPWPTPERPDVAPFLQRQVESLRSVGVDVEVLAFKLDRKLRRMAIARHKVRKWMKTHEYDVLHVHFGWNGLLVGRTAVPVVMSFYGSDLEGAVNKRGCYTISGRVMSLVGRAAARRAQAVIVASRSLARKLPSTTPYHVIPTAVDLGVFTPQPSDVARRELGLDPDRKFVLFAGGTHRPEKRFALAAEAVSRLPADLGASLVTVEGVTRQQVARHMNACDVLLVTSRHEGSPTVVKEALACDLPVVSVDVGDVREWIGALDGCYVCTDDSPETIAHALEKSLRSAGTFHGRAVATRAGDEHLAQLVKSIYATLARGGIEGREGKGGA